MPRAGRRPVTAAPEDPPGRRNGERRSAENRHVGESAGAESLASQLYASNMERVSAASLSRIAERPGGPTLRQQFREKEKALHEREQKKLDACKTPEERGALKAQFTQARAERARRYAAMLCSEPGWTPKGDPKGPGTILTSFYALIGQRAREEARKSGKPFSMGDVEKVRLTREDVEELRKKFGDAEVKKAWPLLQKHIAHEGFLDRDALRFMKSTQFLAFQAAITATVDRVERAIDQHQETLSAKDAELLRDHHRGLEKRRLSVWDQPVVVESEQKSDGSRDKVTYVAVGGRLVPVDRDEER